MFHKVVLEFKFVFNPFPTHIVLFSGHISCPAEIAFVNKLGNVHKWPGASWKRYSFRGTHELCGDKPEWDTPRYLWKGFLLNSWKREQEYIPLMSKSLALPISSAKKFSTLSLQDSLVLVQCCLGEGVFLEEFFSLLCTKLISLSFQCNAGFITKGSSISTNSLSPISICPFVYSSGFPLPSQWVGVC